MSPSFQRSLLRRTLFAFAAIAAFAVSIPASALTVTLNGSSGTSCTYTGMTVDPAGNVQVSCDTGTPAPGNPGTFSLSVATSMNTSSTTTATVTRSGGVTGAVNVAYSASGGCSLGGTGTLSFTDGIGTAQTFTVSSPATAASCIIGITPTGGSTGTGSVTITVSASTTPPPPPPPSTAACPAGFVAPSNMLTASFQGLGQWWAQMQKSGQVVSIPLPNVQTYSKQAVFGENSSAYSPQPVVIEITISQCPGYIETDAANPTATHPNGNFCNLRSPNGANNSVTWFGKPFGTALVDAASAKRYGYCWAPEGDANGPWYVNARWTYSSCPLGQAVCGFAIQQNLGPY